MIGDVIVDKAITKLLVDKAITKRNDQLVRVMSVSPEISELITISFTYCKHELANVV